MGLVNKAKCNLTTSQVTVFFLVHYLCINSTSKWFKLILTVKL